MHEKYKLSVSLVYIEQIRLFFRVFDNFQWNIHLVHIQRIATTTVIS